MRDSDSADCTERDRLSRGGELTPVDRGTPTLIEQDLAPPGLQAWRREILRYVHRLTGDADLAEDVAQDTLLRLLTADAASMYNPRAWLFRVATNLVRDTARKQEVRQRRAIPVDTDEPSRPDQELDRRESIRHVRTVLDRLSTRDRELLILRESGFPYRDIAEVIGVKTESVPTLAARALARFRAALEAEESDVASR